MRHNFRYFRAIPAILLLGHVTTGYCQSDVDRQLLKGKPQTVTKTYELYRQGKPALKLKKVDHYDINGNLLSSERYGSRSSDSPISHLQYSYKNGKLYSIKKTAFRPTRSKVTRVTWLDGNREQRETRLTGDQKKIEERQYDDQGRMKSFVSYTVDRKEGKTVYAFDLMKILYFYGDGNLKTKQETWKLAVTSGGTTPDGANSLNTKLELATVQNYFYDTNRNHVRSEGSQGKHKRLIIIDKQDSRGNPLEQTSYRVKSFGSDADRIVAGKIYYEYTYHP